MPVARQQDYGHYGVMGTWRKRTDLPSKGAVEPLQRRLNLHQPTPTSPTTITNAAAPHTGLLGDAAAEQWRCCGYTPAGIMSPPASWQVTHSAGAFMYFFFLVSKQKEIDAAESLPVNLWIATINEAFT